DRRVGLRVERFLVGDAAGQEDVDDALRLGRNKVVMLLFGLGVLHAEVIAEREAQTGQRSDRKETTTIDVRAQTHTDLPKCLRPHSVLRPHRACSRVCSVVRLCAMDWRSARASGVCSRLTRWLDRNALFTN